MSILQHLATLAVPALLKGTCQALGFKAGEDAVDGTVRFCRNRFTDHSQQLTQALQRANDRAWKALEVALAGDSWWAKAKGLLAQGEERALAEPIRQFLQTASLPSLQGQDKIRQRCLLELRAAQKKKLLTRGNLDVQRLFQQTAALIRFDEPQKVLNAEFQLLDGVAAELEGMGGKALCWLLRQRPTQGSPLLVLLVRYFFRREVETNEELFRGLVWDKMDRLTQGQEAAFQALNDLLSRHLQRLETLLVEVQAVVVKTHDHVLDLKEEVQRQGQQMQELGLAVQKALEQYQLDRRAVSSRDSLSLRSDAERQLVKSLVARYRALPAEQQRQGPALLNALGKLQVLAGDFDAAQQNFQKVTTLVEDPKAQAEAHHNAYVAALERRDWKAALRELVLAVKLDPAQFAPFPLDKYVPQRILGAGGFGVAFLCQHQYMNAPVVVKALQADGLERNAEQVFAEAHALRQLDHPSIIRIQDCAFTDAAGKSRPYLVMDYFKGDTLEEQVRRYGALSIADGLAVVTLLAEALGAAHDKGILHRDVKPANILVCAGHGRDRCSWEAKLIDFGLAFHHRSLGSTMHGRGHQQKTLIGSSIAGTLNYAAPEQLGQISGVKVGPYSDIYGLAKTCCYALFQTTQPLPKHWRSLPQALADLLEQCLEEDPRKRPQDCIAVLRLLKAAASPPVNALEEVIDLAEVMEVPSAVPSPTPAWLTVVDPAEEDLMELPAAPLLLEEVPATPTSRTPVARTSAVQKDHAAELRVPSSPPVVSQHRHQAQDQDQQRQRRADFLCAMRLLLRHHRDVRRAGGSWASIKLLLFMVLPGTLVSAVMAASQPVWTLIGSTVTLMVAASVQSSRTEKAKARQNKAIQQIEHQYPDEVARLGGRDVLVHADTTREVIRILESAVN